MLIKIEVKSNLKQTNHYQQKDNNIQELCQDKVQKIKIKKKNKNKDKNYLLKFQNYLTLKMISAMEEVQVVMMKIRLKNK